MQLVLKKTFYTTSSAVLVTAQTALCSQQKLPVACIIPAQSSMGTAKPHLCGCQAKFVLLFACHIVAPQAFGQRKSRGFKQEGNSRGIVCPGRVEVGGVEAPHVAVLERHNGRDQGGSALEGEDLAR